MPENKANTRVTTNPDKPEMIVERVFNAPRELVFKAWTEPTQLAQWWAPQGWTTKVFKMEVKPGGTWHYCMYGPDGEEAWGKAVYEEITPPERLVYVDNFADAQGKVNPEMPTLKTIVTFEENNGKTKLTSYVQVGSMEELEALKAMGMIQGLNESWDQLEALLAQA
jgi:uncharacterized protein YndB with AHSA1/START domain